VTPPPTRQETDKRMVQGPLVWQPEPAARLATVLNHAATELWDASTLDDAGQMWEEARAIASRILASCPID
jgi:hypothetical protein